MKINPINNTNFKAKLDVSKCKNYKPYWDAVAKNFEERTMHKKGTLIFSPANFGNAPNFLIKGSETKISCDTNIFNKLTNSYPIEMAENLAKLFVLGKEFNKEINSIDKTFQKTYGRITANNFEQYIEIANQKEDEINKKIAERIASDETI